MRVAGTDDNPLSIIFRHERPSHYVARLGKGGWLEGWGWTSEDALANLAARVRELQPDGSIDFASLAAHAPTPTLDE